MDTESFCLCSSICFILQTPVRLTTRRDVLQICPVYSVHQLVAVSEIIAEMKVSGI